MTQPKQPFINETSQADRYAVLVNDKRQKNTYLSHTHDADEMGGRFKAVHTQTVIGEQPQIQYPRASDWACTALPPEEPLGYAIDEQIAVGTEAEIQASLGNDRSSTSSPPVVAMSEDDARLPASPRSTSSSSAGALSAERGKGGDHGSDQSSLRRSPPQPFRRV